MGKRLFPDGILTNDGGIAALDPALLQRSDTGEWEAVQEGVLYFSPNQHGGNYGKVVRQYWNGTNFFSELNGSNISGADQIIDMGGWCLANSGEKYPFPFQDGGVTADYYNSAFRINIAFDEAYDVWVDYNMSTPPTRSPSSKVLPTIDPTVLQRVDDMTWENVPSFSGNIESVTQNVGNIVIHSAGHTVENGNTVLLRGTTSYDGNYTASNVVAGVSFEVTDTYVASETGHWYKSGVSDDYFSPEQHGSVVGKVIRRYACLVITSAGTLQIVDTNSTIKHFVNWGGSSSDHDTSPFEGALGGYNSAGDFSGLIMQETGVTAWEVGVSVGGSADEVGDLIQVWYDYVKLTEPTTRPTGQPFADPNSGLLKNASTGKWEIPVVGDEYYAGFFGSDQVYAQRFVSSGTSGDVTLIASGVDYPVKASGWLKDSASGGIITVNSFVGFSAWSQVNVNAGAMQIQRGSDFAGTADTFDIIAYYTKL